MDRSPWAEQYMREMSRKKRRRLLDEVIAEEGMSPENELRLKLHEARFGINEKAEVDYFIRGWMTLYNLQNVSRGLFGKKRIARDLASVHADWKEEMAGAYGSIGEEVLYQELFHMILFYIRLCQTDRNYSSVLLGFGRMQDQNLTAKIAGDIYRTAWEIPEQQNCAGEFRLLQRAAADAFAEAFPDDEDLLLRRIRKGGND